MKNEPGSVYYRYTGAGVVTCFGYRKNGFNHDRFGVIRKPKSCFTATRSRIDYH